MGRGSILLALLALCGITVVLGASQPNKLTCHSNFSFTEPPGKWYTKKNANGMWYFHNDAISPEPQVLRGISMTGWETGTRMTQAGAGYWLFQVEGADNADGSEIMVRNVVKTLITVWGMRIIRMPICGSGFTQQYVISGWGKQMAIPYRYWVDIPVCEGLRLGAVTIIDNHLWAVGKETATTKNAGPEDGCTGINKVDGTDSCAPHDWYGEYTSPRTKKTYNKGDDQLVWQCSIANADGCTLGNIMRNSKAILEHFENLFYELAERYKGHSYVWFELFNEPYERLSATHGTTFGDNIPEANYDWAGWTEYNERVIKVIRQEQGCDNIILVSGHDWSYDYLGDPKATTNTGPILNPKLLTWLDVPNIAYAFHPYQHGSCCGAIGSTSDLSITDPYQSAFCLYPKFDNKSTTGMHVVSNSPVPAPSAKCDTAGYAETVNKKSPPCVWVDAALKGEWASDHAPGLCAGDRDECDTLSKEDCLKKENNWADPSAGGWSKYVLPMAKYGPLIATEFGPFDCSSPFTRVFLKWCRQFGVSYTAWALWPQNSGGPGAGACGYPSVMVPSAGNGDGFGKGTNKCDTLAGCTKLLKPAPWSGVLVAADIADNLCKTSPCKNGGTCWDNGMSVTCKCTAAYHGQYCDSSFTGACKDLPCKFGTCEETGGSFKCTCPSFGAYTGADCADVNECATSNGGCHIPHGVCTNTPGSRSCACEKGTEGDGFSCSYPEVWVYNDDLIPPWKIDNPITGFKWVVTTGDMPTPRAKAYGEGSVGANMEIQLKTTKQVDPTKYSHLEFYFRFTTTNDSSDFLAYFNMDQQKLIHWFHNISSGTWNRAKLELGTDIPVPSSIEFIRLKNANNIANTIAIAYMHFYTPDGEGACADAPCLHGLCKAGEGTAYTCKCQDGWSGDNCGTDVNECETSNGGCPSAAAHGQCTNTAGSRTCSCENSYTLDVTTNTCKAGSVETNVCLPNPCQNSGVCAKDTTAASGYKCTCSGGYSGTTCQTAPPADKCASSPCLHGGTCKIVNNAVSCSCTTDYSGTSCQTPKQSACTSKPCAHGTCTVTGSGYSCECEADFNGPTCSNPVNPTTPCQPNPCVHGSCTVAGTSFTCKCVSSYTGDLCNQPPTTGPCAADPCSNQGTCVESGSDFSCNCPKEWQGRTCDVKAGAVTTPGTSDSGSGTTIVIILVILAVLIIAGLVAYYFVRRNNMQKQTMNTGHMQQGYGVPTNTNSAYAPQAPRANAAAAYTPQPPRTLPARPTGQSVNTRGAWEEYRTTDGYPYFYNTKTGQTSWTMPQ